MDYEKAYKEALEKARSWHNAPNSDKMPTTVKRISEELFPELKESEDERIRKYLISLVKNWDKDGIVSKYTSDANDIKQILAWLEKQGKETSMVVWHSVSEAQNEMEELLCEWESDDATWHDVAFYHADTKTFWNGERQVIDVTRWCYVDELVEKQGEQKPTWSDEDEKMLKNLIDYFKIDDALQYSEKEVIGWLKSIKERLS